MGKPWDDPEEKFNKKLRKIGRNAAYAIGVSIGIFIIAVLYPKEEGSENIASIMADFSLVLFIHGGVLLVGLIFARKRALLIAALMLWLITPSWILYLVLQYSGSF